MNFRLTNESDWKRIVEYVKRLSWHFDGKPITYKVSIDELKPTRSLEQNARYWALLTQISKVASEHMMGEYHDPETWHHYCRRRFLGMESGPFGEGVPKSTRKLRVGPFGDYMTQIEAWCAETFPGWDFGYDRVA